ncbi:MAG: hypothetical protein AAFQ45_08580 [Pseudomonadota bacterium]
MSRLKTVAAATALLGALAIATPGPAEAQQKPPRQDGSRFTCTQISKQCRRACVKEAPLQFCRGYCLDQKEACLASGTWDGIKRNFVNVRKR